jgi:peptide/nickel transport system substrate-binding protein
MRARQWALPAGLVAVLLVGAGCGRSATQAGSATGSGAQSAASSLALSATTPAAKGTTGTITWALYREVNTLDPIQAFDYPENTAIAAMCDSLLRQQPDGSIAPGLATASHPDPKTLVLKLHPGATFWDSKAVTPADVAFSLERNMNPKLGGFYGAVFTRVASIAATGPQEVTIHLKQPDYWLDGELSQMPGVVLEKAYVQSKGAKFGSPQGGTMCSGAFELKSWKPGTALEIEASPGYWDAGRRAKTKVIVFKGVTDDASLTSGLLTGAIDGTYQPPLSTIEQLKASSAVEVIEGPSFQSDALVVSSLKGVLGDRRVRQALSLAIDRRAYISRQYHGFATMPRTLANPGTWGYARNVFEQDWNGLPNPPYDVARAKALVKQAGVAGKTLTIGMSPEIGPINTAATALRTAAEDAGLKVKFKAVSAQNFINFFTDPKARAGVDGFPTVNYPDYADPAAYYATFALRVGSQNYDGFQNPRVTQLLATARTTADPTARAKLVAQAGDLISKQLPWIPLADPNTALVMNKRITGMPSSFVYMGGPWADGIGAAG